jgi:epoxyqueuosine reductase
MTSAGNLDSSLDDGGGLPITPLEIARRLKQQAGLLGFAEARIAPAVEPARYPEFLSWLENGYAGEMHYLATRREAYRHPDSVLAGAKTILVLALPYSPLGSSTQSPTLGVGKIARYASGTVDYHDWIHDRLKRLGQWLEQTYRHSDESKRQALSWRGIVDTAPLLEREFAQLSGLGWIGKNTLLLNRNLGSYFFLACLLTNLDLPCDPNDAQDYCGSCRACIDACPTAAFVAPHRMDASRCISYLTIEQRSLPPSELRASMGDWLYGCDICQEVCPWNRKAPSLVESAFQPAPQFTELRLIEILAMDQEQFRQHFRHTPFWRAKRRGVIRNAAIVAGNQQALECLEPLRRLLQDEDELIRAAAVWAITQMPIDNTTNLLETLRELETSPLVQAELQSYFKSRIESS